MNLDKSSRRFSYVLVARIIGTALQSIFYFVFAALLEPEVYGELSYYIALAGTFSIISRFGLPSTVTVSQAKKNEEFSNQINVITIITTGVAAIIVIPINIYVALLLLGISFFSMNQSNLLGLQLYKKYFITSLTKAGLLIVIPFLLYFVLDLPGILIGMAISNLIASTYFFQKINFKIQSFNKLKLNYKVIIHNFGVEAAINLSRRVDKLLIAPLLGFASVGIYQFNIQILFGLELIPMALYFFLLSEESSGKNNKKVIFIVLLLSIIVVILSILFLPFVIDQLFPKYNEGVFALQILIIALIPLSFSAILNAKLQSNESTKVGYSALIRIGSLLALITILGNTYGLIGLSISVLLSIIFYTIFLYILLLHQKKKEKNKN